MSKNVRISLYILIPIIGWVISGRFIEEEVLEKKSSQELTSVIVEKSDAEFFSPKVTLNAAATSEKRVSVIAKTSGEVMPNNVNQGQWVQKDQVLCRLGVVELNRTEVKAPFRGYVEKIINVSDINNVITNAELLIKREGKKVSLQNKGVTSQYDLLIFEYFYSCFRSKLFRII